MVAKSLEQQSQREPSCTSVPVCCSWSSRVPSDLQRRGFIGEEGKRSVSYSAVVLDEESKNKINDLLEHFNNEMRTHAAMLNGKLTVALSELKVWESKWNDLKVLQARIKELKTSVKKDT